MNDTEEQSSLLGAGVLMSVVVGLLGWVAGLLDVLPYYGFCANGREHALTFWPVLWLIALVTFVVWTLGAIVVAIGSHDFRRAWVDPLLAIVVSVVFLVIGNVASSAARTFALEKFAERMEPVVAAVGAHTARHGSPPHVLELVATPPPANLCAEGELTYEVEAREGWSLALTLIDSYPRKELVIYRSNRELRYRERRIRDWGWQKWE